MTSLFDFRLDNEIQTITDDFVHLVIPCVCG